MKIEDRLNILEAKIDALLNGVQNISEWWVAHTRFSSITPIYVFDTEKEAQEFLDRNTLASGKKFAKNGELSKYDVQDVKIIQKPKGYSDFLDLENRVPYYSDNYYD